jgi:uncharacterized protein (TIGR04255 family)
VRANEGGDTEPVALRRTASPLSKCKNMFVNRVGYCEVIGAVALINVSSNRMTYPRAPITEAVMDIRVQARDGLTAEELRVLSKGTGEDFAQVKERLHVATRITPGPLATSQMMSPTKVGFEFRNAAGDKVVQAQLDGWSFSKLAPYESWEVFRDEGRELWTRYRELAQPKQISRMALRYINRLDLPLPFDDFKKFLRTVPEIAPDLPQALSNFFLQAQIPQLDLEAMLVINMTMVPPPTATVASIVLDLDLFRTTNLPNTEDELWSFFEQLRARKNQAFEACITDAMRERFY